MTAPSAAAAIPAVKPAAPAGAAAPYAPPDDQAKARAVALATRTLAGGSALVERSPDDRFGTPRAVFGAGGLQFLSFPRAYRGLPVYGGDVNFMISRDGGTLHYATSAQRAEIDVDVTPRIDAARAAAVARTVAGPGATIRSTRLVVHATGASPRTAWEVVAQGRSRDGVPAEPHVFVDAGSGQVVESWDAVRHGTGHSYFNGDPVRIDTTASETGYSLRDPSRPGIECSAVGRVFDGTDDDWGNGTATDVETACVDTLFGVQREWDMLREWTGRNGIDGQGRGFPAIVGYNMPNATWSGTEVNMGRNTAGSKQTTSLDVVGHEYGHGVFQFSGSGGAGGDGWMAAMNESTGDILGAMLEHYVGHPEALDEPDYLVGEEIDLFGTGAIRNMYNPAQIDDHPNCFTTTAPDAHPGSGPQNHWFYLLAEGSNPTNGNPASPTCDGTRVTGIGIQKAGKIFVNALQMKTASWGPGAARLATIQAAYALFPNSCTEMNAVKAAWSAVNVPTQPGELIVECWPESFDLSLSPAQGTVVAGQSATRTVVQTRTLQGPPPQVTLSTAGVPDGITVSIAPGQVTAGGTAQVTITTRPDVPPGLYRFQVVGTAGPITQRAPFDLTVITLPPKILITVQPHTVVLDQELKGSATLLSGPSGGTPIPLRLSASGGPPGMTVGFTPAEITAGQSSAIAIAATRSTPPGTYQVTLQAIGDVAATAALTVQVPERGPRPQAWRPYTRYQVGDRVTYDGQVYRCLRTHVSQPGRTPPRTPALWARV
ncbi:M4 family metallopeptidase [Sphaerisporangium krabiense]|uniref:M4 family metallopeptidase n=1 Tax=Sphaerisporangium krabiense TaxID=763782 RepID=UPI001C84B22E|nr:M4 family metallopeptidase [Sphaerisporangium krabiense]